MTPFAKEGSSAAGSVGIVPREDDDSNSSSSGGSTFKISIEAEERIRIILQKPSCSDDETNVTANKNDCLNTRIKVVSSAPDRTEKKDHRKQSRNVAGSPSSGSKRTNKSSSASSSTNNTNDTPASTPFDNNNNSAGIRPLLINTPPTPPSSSAST